jgi:hypothetical protein
LIVERAPPEPQREQFPDEESYLEARDGWRHRVMPILSAVRSALLRASRDRKSSRPPGPKKAPARQAGGQEESDPVLALLKFEGRPVTRENYLKAANWGKMPEFDAEEEADLPPQLRRPTC